MEEITLKDVLDVVIDMKVDLKEVKQEMKQMREEMDNGFIKVNERIDAVEKEQQEMKQEIKEMKQEQQEMKQEIKEMKKEQQVMKQDINRNFNEIKETQRKILQLESEVIVETKWIVQRIGEDEAKIRKVEKEQITNKKNKGKIIEFKGKNT